MRKPRKYAIVLFGVALGVAVLAAAIVGHWHAPRHPEQIPTMADRLRAIFQVRDQEEQSKRVHEAVAQAAREPDMSAFQEAMDSPDPALRCSALLVLTACVQFYEGRLDVQVAESVRNRLETSAATEAAVIRILSDPVPGNRVLASILLSNCWPSSARAHEAARKILKDEEVVASQECDQLISVLECEPDKQDWDLLLELSKKQDVLISTKATAALAGNGDRNALLSMIDFLDHTDSVIRNIAEHTLVRVTRLSAESVAVSGDPRTNLVAANRRRSEEEQRVYNTYWNRFINPTNPKNVDFAKLVKSVWLNWWSDNSKTLRWNKAQGLFEIVPPHSTSADSDTGDMQDR